MKCEVCNKTNKIDAAICIHCGAKIHLESYIGEAERSTVGKYKMALNKKIFIILISVLSGLVIVLLILLITPRNENRENTGVIISQQSGQNTHTETVRETQVQQSQVETETATQVRSDQQGAGVVTATVKDYRLRMRSKPDARSSIVDHLPKGAIVIVLAKSGQTKIRLGNKMVSGQWYQIKWEKPLDDGKFKPLIGWVWGDFLIFGNN